MDGERSRKSTPPRPTRHTLEVKLWRIARCRSHITRRRQHWSPLSQLSHVKPVFWREAMLAARPTRWWSEQCRERFHTTLAPSPELIPWECCKCVCIDVFLEWMVHLNTWAAQLIYRETKQQHSRLSRLAFLDLGASLGTSPHLPPVTHAHAESYTAAVE